MTVAMVLRIQRRERTRLEESMANRETKNEIKVISYSWPRMAPISRLMVTA